MDFKTKTALCIARLYNSSACVFWLAQTPTERTQQLKDGYWCRTSWRLCFLVEYLAFELGQAFPGHLCHPELAAAAVPAVRSSCGHSRKVLPAGGTTLEQLLQRRELSGTMGNPPGLWIVSRGMCCLLELSSPAAGSGAQGGPGLQPLGLGGTTQGRAGQDTTGSCPCTTPGDAPRVLQHRTLQVLFQKQSTKGIAQQTCAHDKRKLHPLCSARMEF